MKPESKNPPNETDSAKHAPAPPWPDNFQTLLDAGTAHAELKAVGFSQTETPVAIIPRGYKLQIVPHEDMEQWAGKPTRKTGCFHFGDIESFVRYFNEHKTDASRVFAKLSDTGGTFYGILNFHGAEPSFNDHRCAMALEPTHEWNVWMRNAKQLMTQPSFAQFLEENAEMFVTPRGADLLELVSTLEGKSHVDITQAVRLQTGAIKVQYSETVELRGGGTGSQAGDLMVPKELTVAIAPFEGTYQTEMRARLRYRIENKKILFWYEPIDAHLHVRKICADIINAIQVQTGTEPFKISTNGLTTEASDDDKPW